MGSIIKGRHWVAVGMFLLALLLYIDRVCISVAKDPIAGDLQLSDKAMGWILSAFALGYALLQVPSGIMADRFGPRRVLVGIVSFWSGLTALTGAAWNFLSLLLIRFLFGAGEAGAFPSMSRAIYSWMPLQERGLVLGLNFSGSRLGAAFALPLVAWLIDQHGWRITFLILGAIGVIWAVGWWLLFRDRPEDHPGMHKGELNYIVANRQGQSEAKAAPLSRKQLLA
ncbi:MAG: MFS transporter, partial [Bacteroidota bacterium]